jgi:drug/metabolite transporter (DMT)-like permease
MGMYLILFIQQLIAASTHVVSKSLTATVHPSVLLLFRAGVASLIFLIWIFFNRKKLPKFQKGDERTFVILGILCIPLNQYLFFTSVNLTTAPNVSLAYALCPAFVVIMEILYLKVKASKLKLAGIAIAFLGALTIFAERGIDLSSQYFLGNIIALIASFSWALYTIIGKNIIKRMGAIYSTGLAIIFGYILYLPIYFFTGDRTSIAAIDLSAGVKIAYLGVFTSVVGYALWYWVLERMEASKLSVFNNLQPVLTALLAAIFLSFNFTLPFALGGVLVLIGVFMTQRAK